MVEIKSHRLRSILKILIPFVLVPLAAVLGTLDFDEKKAYLCLSVRSDPCNRFVYCGL